MPIGSRRRHCAALLVLLLCAATASAAVQCRVDIVVPWSGGEWSPVVVKATSAREHRTALRITNGTAATTVELKLVPGVTDRRCLLIPPNQNPWDNGFVAQWRDVDGNDERDHESPVLDREAACVVVQAPGRTRHGLPLDKLAIIRPQGFTDSRHHGSGTAKPAAVLDADLLPEHWQAYPPWLVLVFAPGAEERIGAAQRQAILRWAAQGGRLVVQPRAVAAWSVAGTVPQTLPMQGDAMAGPDDARWPRLVAACTGATFSQGFELDVPGDEVPGTDHLGGGLLAVLAGLIVVVAGPLPLWLARRRQQPLSLLVFIPIAGAASCLVLLSWDLARFGIGARRTAAELTLVDTERAEHTAWSGQARFGAWGVGTLSTAAGERWLFPRSRDYDWRRMRDVNATLAWDRQALSGALLRGRITEQVACTVVRPDRRRVAVQRSGDGWTVANGLGSTLTAFAWRGPDQRWWSAAAPVADGATVPLTATGHPPTAAVLPRLPVAADVVWKRMFQQPGGWLARCDRPLSPLPGPEAEDVIPMHVLACGLCPAGAEAAP